MSKEIVDNLVKTFYDHFPNVTNDFEAARKHLKDAMTHSLKTNYPEYKTTLYCYPLSAISSKMEFHYIGVYGDNYEIPWRTAYDYGLLIIKLEDNKGSWLKYVWAPATFRRTKDLLMHNYEEKVYELFGKVENRLYNHVYVSADLQTPQHLVETYQKLIEKTCKVTKKRGLHD